MKLMYQPGFAQDMVQYMYMYLEYVWSGEALTCSPHQSSYSVAHYELMVALGRILGQTQLNQVLLPDVAKGTVECSQAISSDPLLSKVSDVFTRNSQDQFQKL